MKTIFVNRGSDENLLKSLVEKPNVNQEELLKAIDKSKLVQVEIQVKGKNGMYTRKQWKSAGDVKSTDKVIGGAKPKKELTKYHQTMVDDMLTLDRTVKANIEELNNLKSKRKDGAGDKTLEREIKKVAEKVVDAQTDRAAYIDELVGDGVYTNSEITEMLKNNEADFDTLKDKVVGGDKPEKGHIKESTKEAVKEVADRLINYSLVSGESSRKVDNIQIISEDDKTYTVAVDYTSKVKVPIGDGRFEIEEDYGKTSVKISKEEVEKEEEVKRKDDLGTLKSEVDTLQQSYDKQRKKLKSLPRGFGASTSERKKEERYKKESEKLDMINSKIVSLEKKIEKLETSPKDSASEEKFSAKKLGFKQGGQYVVDDLNGLDKEFGVKDYSIGAPGNGRITLENGETISFVDVSSNSVNKTRYTHKGKQFDTVEGLKESLRPKSSTKTPVPTPKQAASKKPDTSTVDGVKKTVSSLIVPSSSAKIAVADRGERAKVSMKSVTKEEFDTLVKNLESSGVKISKSRFTDKGDGKGEATIRIVKEAQTKDGDS